MKRPNKLIEGSGITLIVLVISIVIAIILSTAAVLNMNNIVADANKVNFARELETITEKTKEYYTQNNEIPLIADTNEMSLSDILNLASLSDDDKNDLMFEVNEANDNFDNIQVKKFYQIDLKKLGLKNSKRGYKRFGNNDVYIVSDSMTVYYLKGISLGSERYFSLSTKLTSVRNINEKEVIYDSVESAHLTVKKEKNTWTNKLGINVITNMSLDEKLYIKLPNTNKMLVNTSQGLNNFTFNSFEELIASSFFNNVQTLTQQQIDEFKSLVQSEKHVVFIKTKNDSDIANVNISLSNYETDNPLYDNNNITIVESDKENIIRVDISDKISKIKEVRYEYLTKYNDNNVIVNYYNNLNISNEYLLSNGKKASICFQTTSCLVIPKNVNSVRVIAIDNAGNVNMFDIDNTSNPVILNATTKTITSTQINFTVNILAKNKNVSKIYTYLSLDGSNYSNEIIYDATSNVNAYAVNCNYSNIQNAKKSILIKVIAYDNSNPKKELYTTYINANPVIDQTPIPTSNLKVDYDMTSWGSGSDYYYSITFNITNLSDTSVNGWDLEMDFLSGYSIANIWNSSYKASNSRITFSNLSYNNLIEKNKTVSFGVQIKCSAVDFIPYNIKVNNQAIPNKEKPTVTGNIEVNYNLQSKWQSGSYYYYSYSIDVSNKTSAIIKTWAFDITTDTTGSISQIWSAKYTSSNYVFSISNVDYNGVIQINAKTNFGIVIQTKNSNFTPVVNNLKFTY